MAKIDFNQLPPVIGIVGSRSFANDVTTTIRIRNRVGRFISQTHFGTQIVSGGAEGVDQWAVLAAKAHNRKIKEFLPDSKLPSPTRYFTRNKKIVDYLYANGGMLVAFKDTESCSGTMNTVRAAKKLGVPVLELNFTPEGICAGYTHHGTIHFTDD